MDINEAKQKLADLKRRYDDNLEHIDDAFWNLADKDKLRIIRDFLDANQYERFYQMSDFDELMAGKSPSDIVRDLADGFCINDDYFWFDNYENAVSGSASDVISRFGDDVDSSWLIGHYDEYGDAFADFCEVLAELGDEYDEIIDSLDEQGVDTSSLGFIDD